jgi:hypothetical protein
MTELRLMCMGQDWEGRGGGEMALETRRRIRTKGGLEDSGVGRGQKERRGFC